MMLPGDVPRFLFIDKWVDSRKSENPIFMMIFGTPDLVWSPDDVSQLSSPLVQLGDDGIDL